LIIFKRLWILMGLQDGTRFRTGASSIILSIYGAPRLS
jgi:hypothetical protein